MTDAAATASPFAVVILAAGRATRMRSSRHKSLLGVGGLPMVRHVLAAAREAGAARVLVVVAPTAEGLADAVADAEVVEQATPAGTAAAVATALPRLDGFTGPLVALYGDCPLIRPATIRRMADAFADDPRPGAAVLTIPAAAPAHLGVIGPGYDTPWWLSEGGPGPLDTGFLALDTGRLLPWLDRLSPHGNGGAERHLPDLLSLLRAEGIPVASVPADTREVLGANDRVELAMVEGLWQKRRRYGVLRSGVTMADPSSVILHHDTQIGPDAWIGPCTTFGPGVRVGEGAVIEGHSFLAGVDIPAGAVVPAGTIRGQAGADDRSA